MNFLRLTLTKTKLVITALAATLLTACGGGGGESNPPNTPSYSYAIMRVNKDGLNNTAPLSQSTSLVQNSSSGYRSSSSLSTEWSGSNMSYTAGYINPTSGTLNYYKFTSGDGLNLWWSVASVNYDISLTSPSTDLGILAQNAFAAASETKIYGGVENDKTYFLRSTSEVDLAGGLDTLVLSQNFNVYTFTRVPGSTSSINVSRDGHLTNVKNVEYFEFADGTKNISQILALLL